MKPEFQLFVHREALYQGASFRVSSSGRISLGATPDGAVMTALLGVAGREDTAGQVAVRYELEGREPARGSADGAACVILDQRSGEVIVVAPPIGLRQVFWAANGNRLGLASQPTSLTGIGGSSEIDAAALFRYVYFHVLPGPASIYAGVSKLDGGHRLQWVGGQAQVSRYWRPRFEDAATLTETEASQALHRVLRTAVEQSLGSGSAVGAFLSGGLDSSTVAGLAARHRPGISTVTMGFDAEGYDEMDYARVASRHFGTTPLEYYVTAEDVLSTLPMIAAAFPEPFGNSSAAATYHCARVAREHGLDLLLAGDGGDELFGGNERYAKQLVFERYDRLPHLLRNTLLEPMVGTAAKITRAFPIGKAWSYIQQAKVPLPDRLQTYNFLHQHAPDEVFTRELLAQVDASAPLRLLREEYGVPTTTSPVNRMLFLDWKFTLQDNDLIKVNNMCRLGGVEVAYPMLDPAVVDFSLRIPGGWKVRNCDLRWFYKRAMQDFLPGEVITKTKHGFGLPFGVWTRTHQGLRRMSEDALALLGERGYFKREFLQQALRLHREGHASYYGELVWILMVLELWLQAHHPAARL